MKIRLDLKIYPLEAILNTCYKFIECIYIFLDTDSKARFVKVSMKGKKKLSKKRLAALKGEFMNELLYSVLRHNVSKNNKKIREYIIGRALYSSVSIPDLDLDKEKLNYQDDPLGIAVPWEEKYGKKERVKV